ncbi:hypothetical protein ESCAB7627_4034 [Escherichia albertii TW07627]|uniref:Uncharacterized protein n=1 Tax=Escherichia albertii (strain TW07627) TaxID=502347 RepID=A0ABC9NJT2_ESCAT|nr:hypothetical protein ESCAB7627_4034 [Escherichia albertii TW07627]
MNVMMQSEIAQYFIACKKILRNSVICVDFSHPLLIASGLAELLQNLTLMILNFLG